MRALMLPAKLLGVPAVLALVLCQLVLISARAEPDAVWQAVLSEDKAVELEFPGAPKYEPVQRLSGQGYPYTMHQYVFEAGGSAFQLQTAVYPKDVTVQPQANLQGGLDAVAKTLEGSKWTAVNWTRHQGLVASDAVGVRAGQAIRIFSVLKGQRLVSLTYVGPAESARSEPVERFIKGLKVQ